MPVRSPRSSNRYSVGSRVRVQVSRVDLDGRRIDFRLVREGEADKPVGKPERADRARPTTASGELAAVQDADRIAKAATRAFKAGAKSAPGKLAGNGSADSARRSRKPAPTRPAPKPRTRR